MEFHQDDIDYYQLAPTKLLKSAYPFHNDFDFMFTLNKRQSINDKINDFSDKDAVVAYLRERLPSESLVQSFIDNIGKLIKEDEKMEKHFLIGEIILDALGEKARSDYISHCIYNMVIQKAGHK